MRIRISVKYFIFLFILNFSLILGSQTPLYSGVLVSDIGQNNNIGSANTSRNISINEKGEIFVVYSGTEGIRVSKSIDRGESFMPSVQVATTSSEPEILINRFGEIFVAWIEGGNIYLSKSVDEGVTFSSPRHIGTGDGGALHMAAFDDMVYMVDRIGTNVYSNFNRGDGAFRHNRHGLYFYTDIRVDQSGVVYLPSDDPNLFLFKKENSDRTFRSIPLIPPGMIFFSSYALSDGPCGTFIFVGGGGRTTSEGFRINLSNGSITPIVLGINNGKNRGRTLFADNKGTLVDGYQEASGNLMINVSFDQGNNFSTPIFVAKGESHNIDRNPKYEDVNVVYEQGGQVYMSVYDNLLKNISIVDFVSPALCSGESFDLPFELTGAFSLNTNLSVFLSDETGDFRNKMLIGTLKTNMNGSIPCILPNNLIPGSLYKLKIESVKDCTQSESINLTINANIINTPKPLTACDFDNDGIVNSFDTSNVEKELFDGLKYCSVEYFDDQGNKLPSPLPNPYKNSRPYHEEITIKVNKLSSSCTSETKLVLDVFDTPQIKKLEKIQACNEGSGFSSFDLFNLKNQIVIGDKANLSIRYFNQDGVELSERNLKSYTNSKPWKETITIRVENVFVPTCYDESYIDLVVEEKPVLNTLNENYLICRSDSGLYLKSDPNFVSWEWIYKKDGNVISNNFDANIVEEGEYVLNIGALSNGIMCYNSFSFNMERTSLPKIDRVNIVELSNNNSIEIEASGNGEFEYSIDGENYQINPRFDNLQGGVYTSYVRDILGCGEDSREVVLVDFPKYFTPNGDGINDRWFIRGIRGFPGAKVTIFDRYGKLLKELTSNSEGWDGTYNGQMLKTSDYWFVVSLTPLRQVRGHFTLKR
jgi:gliding motility-associated-like protein